MPLYDRMPAHRADSGSCRLARYGNNGKNRCGRQEETYRLQTDSLFSGGKRRRESESIRQWEMICLSPPDSTGRQHVSAVVRSRDTRSSRSFSEDSLRRNVTGTVRQKENNRSRDKAEKQQTPTALWKWAAGVIAVVGGIAGLRRIGRH